MIIEIKSDKGLMEASYTGGKWYGDTSHRLLAEVLQVIALRMAMERTHKAFQAAVSIINPGEEHGT